MNSGNPAEAVFCEAPAQDLSLATRAEAPEKSDWQFSREQELKRWCRGDGQKLRIARRLRAEATMTQPWVAKSLSLGAPVEVGWEALEC